MPRFRRHPERGPHRACPPLAYLICLAVGLAGCGKRPDDSHPSDAKLIAYFHDHRADLDLLRANLQARAQVGFDSLDPVLRGQESELLKRLELRGTGAYEDSNRIFFRVHARPLGRDSVDTKGFAWI